MPSIEKRYFDIQINEQNHTYYFTTSNKKPESKDAALKTLEKIEKVLKEGYLCKTKNFEGLPKAVQDTYIRLKKLPVLKNKEETLKILQVISVNIQKKYNERVNGLKGLAKIFNDRTKINRHVRHIRDLSKRMTITDSPHTMPAHLFIEKVLFASPLKTLNKLAKEKDQIGVVAKKAIILEKKAIIAKAQGLGYETTFDDLDKNYKAANIYIKNLFQQVRSLRFFNKIPAEYYYQPEEALKYYRENMQAEKLISSWNYSYLNEQDVREENKESISFIISSLPPPLTELGIDLNKQLSDAIRGAAQYGELRALEMFLSLIDGKTVPKEQVQALLQIALNSSLVWNRTGHLKAVLGKCKQLNIKPNVFEINLRKVNENVLKILVDAGWDIKTKNKLGRTCLNQLFPLEGFPEKPYKTIQVLLKYGADPNVVIDDKGNTPLHYAAKFRFANVVKLFLAYKADMTIKNNEGETPFDIAKKLFFAPRIKRYFDEAEKKNQI